jgi:hypothetical protein
VTLSLPDARAVTVYEAQERCAALIEWSETAEDIGELDKVRHWVGALEQILPKEADGPVISTARLIEARIGELLGPGEPSNQYTVPSAAKDGISRQERWEFRRMHERRDLWQDKLPLARRRVLRLIRDDEADLRPIIERPVELLSDIREGDFREVLADLPDGSIDLILTDPPYPSEFLPLWSDLAVHAKRLLAPTGMLAAMSGQVHLPEVYRRLGEHLTYRWTMAYMMSGAANVVHARRVSTMWKPVLIYGSTDRRLHDVARSDAGDKQYHGWGQSESGFAELLRLLADPGQTVLDPFLGGGTTAVVSAAYGCHFVGCDIDGEAVAVTVKRLAA